MNIFKYIFNKDYRRDQKDIRLLEAAKKEADRMHNATGYKYYVIVWKDGYKAVNMVWVNRMKKLKLLPKNYDAIRLEKYSVYVTK